MGKETTGADTKKGGVVLQEFRDITNFNKIHKVGDDVSDMAPKRLAELQGAGLVSKAAEAPKEEKSAPAKAGKPDDAAEPLGTDEDKSAKGKKAADDEK